MEHVYVTLEAGDALFFHSNILHRSGPNLSDKPRWSLISCYNRNSNVPYNEPSGKSTIPIDVVPDDALLSRDVTSLGVEADFLEKEKDEALK
jgi:ectoine hydroxylase-related dioxygenase (phytanoyl-CoA dioxygenase family)